MHPSFGNKPFSIDFEIQGTKFLQQKVFCMPLLLTFQLYIVILRELQTGAYVYKGPNKEKVLLRTFVSLC